MEDVAERAASRHDDNAVFKDLSLRESKLKVEPSEDLLALIADCAAPVCSLVELDSIKVDLSRHVHYFAGMSRIRAG